MADNRCGDVQWYSPDPRAIQPFILGDPLGTFHVRRSLAKEIRRNRFEVTTDRCFDRVIHACATLPRREGHGTWINLEIELLYNALYRDGFAHSVEAWQDGELVGGIYGVAIGAAFFGESMFSLKPYASQVCYPWLINHLRKRDFKLMDVQFNNPHIAQFGVVEVPRVKYFKLLELAISYETSWEVD